MTALTPEKIEEISSLLAAAPAETAARLLALFERVKVKGANAIPAAELLSTIRSVGGVVEAAAQTIDRTPGFDRLFFEPFEGLFQSPAQGKLLLGSIDRSGLEEVWQVISRQIAPDDFVELEPHGAAAALRGDLVTARRYAGEYRRAVFDITKSIAPAKLGSLSKSEASRACLERLPALLCAAEAIEEPLSRPVSSNGELSDGAVMALAGLVNHFENERPEAAAEVMLLTMTRLAKPAQALRVLNRAAPRVDDRKLDLTEFAIVGRRLIEMAEREATLIDVASSGGVFEGRSLADAVERYNQLIHGMERELNFAKDGPWKQAIMSLRGRVSTRLEAVCRRASASLEKALPIDQVRLKGAGLVDQPRFGAPLDDARTDQAMRHLLFLSSAKLFAPLAGIGAVREQVSKECTRHLDVVKEAVLHALKQGLATDHLAQWTAHVTILIAAFDGPEGKAIFERRLASASLKAAAG
jgi:hypothetical protein